MAQFFLFRSRPVILFLAVLAFLACLTVADGIVGTSGALAQDHDAHGEETHGEVQADGHEDDQHQE